MSGQDRITRRLARLRAELLDLAAAALVDRKEFENPDGVRGALKDAAALLEQATEKRAYTIKMRAVYLQQDIEEARSEAAFADEGQRELERDARRAP